MARGRAPLEKCPGGGCGEALDAVHFDAVGPLDAAGSWFDKDLDGPVVIIWTDDVRDVGDL